PSHFPVADRRPRLLLGAPRRRSQDHRRRPRRMETHMAAAATRANAIDHIVVVLFENRSLDNVLGRLYGPEDAKTFDGVTGKNLSNPIPAWAQHGVDRKVVPYGITTDMDSPNPDSGEEWYHTTRTSSARSTSTTGASSVRATG